MKFSRMLVTSAIVICLTVTAPLASFGAAGTNSSMAQQTSETQKKDKRECKEKGSRNDWLSQQDPIKALESKKEKVQAQLKEGKITKEKADAITARLDARISEIKKFNSLTLPQKKAKLISDFKSFTDKRVKDGKLTQEKANELIKKYTEKVEKWDGNGYPKLHGKWHDGKGKHPGTDSK